MEDISLKDYYNLLTSHDWYYWFSDNSSVFIRGQDNESVLKKIASFSTKHSDLYDSYKMHKFSGKAFGTSDKPKPQVAE